MTDATPVGYSTVAPWIVTEDTPALLGFISRVLGGEELGRVALEDGSIGHAEIRVGNTVLLAFDRREGWPALPSLLRVWVPDADAAMDAAIGAGATVVTESATSAFGQRGGRIRDPFGNIWWIVTQREIVDDAEGMRRLTEPAYAEGMRRAQQSLDRELGGRGAEPSRPLT